jgi:2'-5' RNA ligase
VPPSWFLAFPVDGRFVQSLPPPPTSIRLFHPEDVHLTLSFLGSCGSARAARALAALDEALSQGDVAGVDVSLAAVVPMGAKREYSALSALLERGRSEVERLISSLRDPVSEAALARREQRPPKPHVTIARPRPRATAAARAAGLTWATGLDLHAVSATLDRIALYTWADGDRRDRLFRVIAERELGPPIGR